MSAEPAPRSRGRFARAELAATASALGLLVALFALPWYGVDGPPSHPRVAVSTLTGAAALPAATLIVLATSALTVLAPLLRLSQRRHRARTDTGRVLAVSATAATALLAWRVLVVLPRPAAVVDQKLGALVGLGCALALTACTWACAGDARANAQAVQAHRPPAH